MSQTRKSLPSPWSFCRTTVGIRPALVPARRGDDGVVVHVDPAYAGITPEPALLAGGETTGPLDDRRRRLLEQAATAQVLQQLLVAERLRRGAGQTAGPSRCARAPRREGRRRAFPVPAAQCARRAHPRGTRSPIWTTSDGECASSPGPNELNGRPLPWQTSSARMTRRRLWGSSGWRREDPGRAAAYRPAVSRSASSGAARPATPRQFQVIDHGADVEAGSSDQHRPATATGNARDGVVGHRSVLRDGERLVRIDDVDAVMGHGTLIGCSRLRGADVHAAVHLHRVGADQLEIGMTAGECHRQCRCRRPSAPTRATSGRTVTPPGPGCAGDGQARRGRR